MPSEKEEDEIKAWQATSRQPSEEEEGETKTTDKMPAREQKRSGS